MSEIIAYKLISGNSSVQAIAALSDIQHQLFLVVQEKNSVFHYQIHSINALNFMDYWNRGKHKKIRDKKNPNAMQVRITNLKCKNSHTSFSP